MIVRLFATQNLEAVRWVRTAKAGVAFHVLAAIALLQMFSWASGAAAQFGDFNSAEGLESATPTDNLNELNGNGSPNASGNNQSGANGFNLDDVENGNFGSNATGESVFDDAPVNDGNGMVSGGLSAFGNGQDPTAAKANAAEKGTIATDPLAPAANAATNLPPVLPAANDTADAQILMNQINGGNPAAPSNAAAGNVPPQPAAPAAISLPEAPPLPPPNEFAGAPPVPGSMRIMAEGEAPEDYLVQPGDTLFDICDQLLDEPAYWPKLWALNPEIKNPHFIFPNMKLRFYPGDDDTPPYLQVVAEDDVIPIDKGNLDEEQLVLAPEKVIFPTEEVIEPSPIEVVGPGEVEDLELVFSSGGIFSGSELKVQVPGFIYGEPREPLAIVLGGRNGEISMAPETKLVLESIGGITAGTLYTVLRPGGELTDPVTGDFVGHRYFFIANVRVLRGVDGDIYIGLVEANSRLAVQPEDILVNYISTNRSIPSGEVVGALSSVQASIVGFQHDLQEIGGAGSYAFLDRGNADGISSGMYLPVFSAPGYLSSMFGNADLPEDYEQVGVMRIIDATDAGAVGYIVRNSQEMRIGDRTFKR